MKKRSFGVLSMTKPRDKKRLLSYSSLFLCGVLRCFHRKIGILSFQGANDVLTVTNEVIQSLWSSLLQQILFPE